MTSRLFLLGMLFGPTGCNSKTSAPATMRLQLMVTNSATISGIYTADGTQFSFSNVTSTNFTVAANKLEYAFTNSANTGEIFLKAWLDDAPKGEVSGTHRIHGKVSKSGVLSTSYHSGN